MMRSFTVLSGAAMLASCVLPTLVSAQDTSSTGRRMTRDSASARSDMMVRFDSAQTVTITGATIVRVDTVGGRSAAGMSGMPASRDAVTGAAGVGMGGTGSRRIGADTTASSRTSTEQRTGMGRTEMGRTGMGRTGMGRTDTAQTGMGRAAPMRPDSAAGRMRVSGRDSIRAGMAGGAGVTASSAMRMNSSAPSAIAMPMPMPSQDSASSLRAVVRTGSDSLHVLLAPSNYLMGQSLMLSPGDVVDLKGMRVATGGLMTLVATEITKGATTVQLRNKSTGTPVWDMQGGMTSDTIVTPMRRVPPNDSIANVRRKPLMDSTRADSTKRKPVRP